jgi:hypothetical protein
MISPKADDYLRNLKFNPDAGIISNFLPLMMLYWEDEINDDILNTWDNSDKFWVYTLLGVRCRLWKGDEVSAERMKIWNHCLATYPDCPIFKRIHVDQSIIDDQLALENETLSFLEDSGFEPVENDGEEKPSEGQTFVRLPRRIDE